MISIPSVSQGEHTEPYVQFPLNTFRRSDLRRLARKWPLTVEWLMAVMSICKDCRSGGALIVAGAPITRDDLDCIHTFTPIDPEWVDDCVEMGLLAYREEDGAIIVSARRQFVRYPSDMPEAAAERKRRSRSAQEVTASVSVPVTATPGDPVPQAPRVAPPVVAPAPPAAPEPVVAVCHESVTSGHEQVTSGRDQDGPRALSQSKSIQSNPSQYKTRQVNPSINPSDPSAKPKKRRRVDEQIDRREIDGRMENVVFERVKDDGLSRSASKAFKNLNPTPDPLRASEMLCAWVDRRLNDGYRVSELVEALDWAGQATPWAQSHGAEPVRKPLAHLFASANNHLLRARERTQDRADAIAEGLPDPGPLVWADPDLVALTRAAA